MTDATIQALEGLRDLSMSEWYVEPTACSRFLSLHKGNTSARKNKKRDAIFAGLTVSFWTFSTKAWNGG
jgi:hypothetical protein